MKRLTILLAIYLAITLALIGHAQQQQVGGVPASVAITSNATNATATLSTISGLSRQVYNGHKYAFILTLMVNNSVAAEGIKVDLNGGSATMTTFRASAQGFDSALQISTQVTSLSTAVSAATFTGDGVIVIRGFINPSADGSFAPRFAENSHTSGTATAYAGSNIVLVETY